MRRSKRLRGAWGYQYHLSERHFARSNRKFRRWVRYSRQARYPGIAPAHVASTAFQSGIIADAVAVTLNWNWEQSEQNQQLVGFFDKWQLNWRCVGSPLGDDTTATDWQCYEVEKLKFRLPSEEDNHILGENRKLRTNAQEGDLSSV